VHGPARATAGTLATVLLLLFAAAHPASGAVKRSERGSPRVHAAHRLLWLVKSNDLRALRQQARADDRTLPAFTWVGCGRPSDIYRCRAGEQPIFTDFRQLQARAEAGWLGTAVFDIEPWRYTPAAERKDPKKWICRAAPDRADHPRPGQ
jgi:hypothetical protein